MAVQAAVSAGPIRRFWLATRWFASKLVALTIASESDSGKSSEELQAWIKRLNPEDGSSGDVRIVGGIAVDHARRHFPALSPAVTKVLDTFDQAFSESTHWDEVLSTCEELRDAIDRFAPPETVTIIQRASQLDELANEFETKWRRLSEDAKSEEARGVRCRRPKVGASECDCVKCRRGSLRNAFYCDCGKELLSAIDAGALLDDDSFLTAVSAGFDFPPNSDQQPLHAWLRATQHWLPQRHPDWGDSREQYPGNRRDADLTSDERAGKVDWMPMRAVAELLREEAGVLSQEFKDSLEASRIIDEWVAEEEALQEEAKTDPGRLRQLAVEKGLCPQEVTQSEASAAVKGWFMQQCGLTLYETDAVPIDCMIAMVDEIAKPDWSNEAPWFTLRVMAGHERHSGLWGWDWEFLDKWQRDPRYERSVLALKYKLREAAVELGVRWTPIVGQNWALDEV